MIFILAISDTNTIYFKGKNLIFLADSDKVILIDSAYVERGNIKLNADTIEFYIEENKVITKGKFQLMIDTSKVEGNNLTYFVDSQWGYAYRTKNYVQKGWLYSNILYKLKGDTLLVERGYFTTCELEEPHYAFYGTDILAINNDMAFVRNVVLKIRGIPVAYVPFWMFPLRRERSSGFLTPNFGFNSLDGKYVRNLGFYWAVNNYMDITLFMDLVERQGVRFGTKLNYAVYKKFRGYINYTFSNDFVPKGISRRYSIDGSHTQKILGFDISARGNYISDEKYAQDYAENKDQWLKTTTTFSLQSSRNFKFANLSILVDYTKNLITNEYSTNLPSINISFTPINLKGVSVSQSASYRNYITHTGKISSLSHSLSFSKNISLPYDFNLPQNLNFSTSFIDSTGEIVMSYSTSISRTIYGRSIFSIWKFKRFYHDITPAIGISYSKTIYTYKKTFPQGYTFAYTYSINNQFSAKFGERRISLASLNLSGNYNPNLKDKPFSPLRISLSFPRFLGISANLSTSYDYYTGKLGEVNGNFAFSLNVGSFRAGATLSFPAKSGSFSLSGKLTKNWTISYSTNLDFNNGLNVLGQNISLKRTIHRWEASLVWSSVGIFSSYDFRIYLKDIPEIKITKGLLNIFFPEI